MPSRDEAGNYVIKPSVPVRRGGDVILSSPFRGGNFSNTQGTDYSYHTLFALSMAFVIVMVTHMTAKNLGNTEETGNAVRDTLNGQSARTSLWGWLFIFIVLLSASSFKSTQSLAAAFSWLILISVLLVNGQSLFRIFSSRSLPQTTKIQSGKYAGKTVPLE